MSSQGLFRPCLRSPWLVLKKSRVQGPEALCKPLLRQRSHSVQKKNLSLKTEPTIFIFHPKLPADSGQRVAVPQLCRDKWALQVKIVQCCVQK